MDDEVSPYLPRRVLRALAAAPRGLDPFRRLWRAACSRLIHDAFGHTGMTDAADHDRAMRDARLWFRHHDDSVEEVFDLAGVPDWEGVREEVVQHEAEYRRDRKRP